MLSVARLCSSCGLRPRGKRGPVEAIKVLKFYGGESASHAMTMAAIHELNDERVDDDEREAWGVQFWAAQAGMTKPRRASRVVVVDQGSVVSFVDACDDDATLATLADLIAAKRAELSTVTPIDRAAKLANAA